MNVYRVWFDAGKIGVFCVLAAAETEKRALELAREQMKNAPEIMNSPYQISAFDFTKENASVC